MSRKIAAVLAAACVVLYGPSAVAQKSQDNVRIAIQDMFPGLDSYVYPSSEASQFRNNMYESVVAYDTRNRRYVGTLAKSWTRTAPNVIEFDLRDDVTFHSGNKLTADDVIYTWKFFANPDLKLRSPSRYNWIADVEKMGPHKIKVVGKEIFVDDLDTIASYFNVFDSQVHAKLANYSDYGRVSAAGTGPYRMTSIDRTSVTLERFDGYKGKMRSVSKRITGVSVPDEQTRVAQLLTGGIDVIRNISIDNAKGLAKNPAIAISSVRGADLMYITLDALGRSENKVLANPRVRKAFMMAIDRDNIIKELLPGNDVTEKPNSICFDWVVNCAYTTKVQAYDPGAAKKLLAEAGYPNGVDLQLSVWDPVQSIAEAVAGDLRKVGMRATIQPMTSSTYVRARGRGELTAFMGTYPIASQPNAVNLFDLFFLADRDYYKDDLIHSSYETAVKELDDTKRLAAYRQAIDRVNERNYIYPFSSLPASFAHTKDIKVVGNVFSGGIVDVNDIVWTDYRGQ